MKRLVCIVLLLCSICSITACGKPEVVVEYVDREVVVEVEKIVEVPIETIVEKETIVEVEIQTCCGNSSLIFGEPYNGYVDIICASCGRVLGFTTFQTFVYVPTITLTANEITVFDDYDWTTMKPGERVENLFLYDHQVVKSFNTETYVTEGNSSSKDCYVNYGCYFTNIKLSSVHIMLMYATDYIGDFNFISGKIMSVNYRYNDYGYIESTEVLVLLD